MRLFGLDITKAAPVAPEPRASGRVPLVASKSLSPAMPSRGGWYTIMESFPGAWQKNVEVKFDSVLSNHADFSCRTQIASDIAKLRIKLVREDKGIWTETTNPAYSPVLRKPNHFQNRIQFIENWVLSKLQRGNTYVLKQRDGRGVVTKLYVLDPNLVTPLVSTDGSVFYQLNTDKLSGLPDSLIVPAREIIHDRFNCFYHPLIGLSPIFAGGLAAMQGLAILNNSAAFFQNGSQPGGILTAPGSIDDADAKRLKEYFESEFSGKNRGRVAVVGDGLKYEALSTKAVDAQMIEQLKWSAEVVCSVYHVPPYKVGLVPLPANSNIQAHNVEYYSGCLQILLESIEACLDEGLGMDGITMGTEFDLSDLLKMDTATQFDVAKKAQGVLTLDEQRRQVGAGPVEGGATIYLQQQDHSLAAIAARDAQLIADVNTPKTVPLPAAKSDMSAEDKALLARAALRKELGLAA